MIKLGSIEVKALQNKTKKKKHFKFYHVIIFNQIFIQICKGMKVNSKKRRYENEFFGISFSRRTSTIETEFCYAMSVVISLVQFDKQPPQVEEVHVQLRSFVMQD